MTVPAFIPGRATPRWWRRIHPAVWGALGATVVLLATGGTWLALRPGGVTGESRQAQSIRLCEDSIRDQLKSPASAKFSGESYIPRTNAATVVGSVDAQNGFGALLRTSFRCTLVQTGGQWTVGLSNIDDPQ